MSEVILVEYKAGYAQLQADSKAIQNELRATEKVGVTAADNTTKAFTKTEEKTVSLKNQLRGLKEDLARATDPKEVERLARAVGKLEDQIGDAADAAKVFASGSKFEQLGNGIGSVTQKLRNLDFEGAADQGRLLVQVVRSISFKDVIQGAKDLGSSLLSLGEAIIGNPLILYTAVIAGVTAVSYKLITAFQEQNNSVNQLTKAYNKLVEVNKFLNAQDDNRIKALQGLKANEDAILEITERKIKRSIEEAKIALQLSILKQKSAQNEVTFLERLIQLSGNQAGADAKKSERIKAANKEIETSYLALESSVADLSKFQNEANQKTIDDQKKLADELLANEKLLRDLRTANIKSDYERQKQVILNNFSDEVNKHKGQDAILVELEKKKSSDLEQLWLDREAKYEKIRKDAQSNDLELFKKHASELKAEDVGLSESFIRNQKAIAESAKKQSEEWKAVISQAIAFIQKALSSAQTINSNISESRVQDEKDKGDRELSNLQSQYDQKLITQQEFEKKKAAIEEAQRKKIAEIKKKEFNNNKNLALIQAAISTALGVTKALELGYPQNLVAIAFAVATGAAEIAAIASQPEPKFAKGVVDLKGKGTKTSDSISAKLSVGESVIIADETAKHKGLLTAMNKRQTMKYINDFYIAPALKAQKKKYDQQRDFSFADSIVKSLSVNNGFYDGNITDSLKQSRRSAKENTLYLASEIRKLSLINPRHNF